VVRRRNPESNNEVAKKVIVARTIKPGQTIRLNDAAHAVRMPSSLDTRSNKSSPIRKGQVRTLPNTLMHGQIAYGPQQDDAGKILEHTLLGSAEDFREEERMIKGHSEEKIEEKVETSISRRGMVDRMRKELEQARLQEEKLRFKELKKLNPADMKQYTKKERIQKRWEARTKAWERERIRMAKKLGRDPDQMIMNLSDEKRARDEEMSDLDMVTLPVEKYGAAAWEMTLRGGSSRVAHVGDYFSGLTTEVPLNSKKREYVRKSTYLLEKTKEKVQKDKSVLKGTKLFKTMTQKTWRDSQFLVKRQKYLNRRLKKARPFHPDALADLIVVGTDLFGDLLPPEEDEEAEDSEMGIVQEEGETDGASNKASGIRVHVEGGMAQSFLLRYPPTPSLENRVQVKVVNTGTCALFVGWARKDDNDDEKHSSSSLDTSPFLVSNPRASLSPGEALLTMISYSPGAAKTGVSTATFALHTEPKIPDLKETPVFTVKGLYPEDDNTLRTRQAAQASITKNVVPSMIQDFLGDMIATKVQPTKPEKKRRPRIYYRANKEHRLYYTPKVLEDFEALAAEILAAQKRVVRNNEVWDFSVAVLKRWIQDIPRRRADLIPSFEKRLEKLVARAKVQPPPNPISFRIVKSLLTPLARGIPKIARDSSLGNGVPLELAEEIRNPHINLPPYIPDSSATDEGGEEDEKKKKKMNDGDNSRGSNDRRKGERGGGKDEEEKEESEEEKAAKAKAAAEEAARQAEEAKKQAELDEKRNVSHAQLSKEVKDRLAGATRQWLLDYEGETEAQKKLFSQTEEKAGRKLFRMWWTGNGGDANSKGYFIPLLEGSSNVLTAVAGGDHCVAVLDNDRVYVWGGEVKQDDQSEEGNKEEEKKEGGKEEEQKEEPGKENVAEKPKLEIPLPPLNLIERLWGLELQCLSVGENGRIVGVDDSGCVWEASKSDQGIYEEAKRISVEAEKPPEEKEGDDQVEKEEEKKDEEGGAEKPKEMVPVKVSSITSATGNSRFVISLDDKSGNLFSWGAAVGVGFEIEGGAETQEAPKLIPSESKFVHVSSGRAHAVAVDAEGKVFAWGEGEKLQLGVPAKKPQTIVVPTSVPFEAETKIRSVSCGDDFTLALTSDGKLYTWGSGECGALGNEDGKDQPTPTLLDAFDGSEVTHIAAGSNHGLAVTKEGVWSWGKGGAGALGHGSLEDQPTPKLIEGTKDIVISRVIAGGAHSILLGQKKSPLPKVSEVEKKEQDQE